MGHVGGYIIDTVKETQSITFIGRAIYGNQKGIYGRKMIIMKRISMIISIMLLAAWFIIFGPATIEAKGAEKCALSGCYRSCLTGERYCKLHKCGESGCRLKKGNNGTIYCDIHAASHAKEQGYKVCIVRGCFKESISICGYCSDHKCMEDGCPYRRCGSSDYCNKHRPVQDNTSAIGNYRYKSSKKRVYNPSNCDPDDYDSPEDFADDAWGDEFDDWDDAYDYWENW